MKKRNTNTESSGQSEAEQFVDFARRIVNVPKSEIDKQQAVWEREKRQGEKRERIIVEQN